MSWGSYEDTDLPYMGVSLFFHYNKIDSYVLRPKGFDGVHYLPKYFQINLAFGTKVWYIRFGKESTILYGITRDDLKSGLFTRVGPGRYI